MSKIARLFRNRVYESEQKNSGKRITRATTRSFNQSRWHCKCRTNWNHWYIRSEFYPTASRFIRSANLIDAYTSDRINVSMFPHRTFRWSLEGKHVSRRGSLRGDVREWLAQLTRSRDSQWQRKFPPNRDPWCVSRELSLVRTASSSTARRSWVEIPRRRRCRPFSSSLSASRYPE